MPEEESKTLLETENLKLIYGRIKNFYVVEKIIDADGEKNRNRKTKPKPKISYHSSLFLALKYFRDKLVVQGDSSELLWTIREALEVIQAQDDLLEREYRIIKQVIAE